MTDIKVTIELPVEDDAGNETIYTIECSLTPYDPGKTSGPPEDCYPPEGGECEILKVSLDGREIKDWETLKLDEEAIAEKAWEKAPSRDDEDPPDPRED
jgi:hypothetical protein